MRDVRQIIQSKSEQNEILRQNTIKVNVNDTNVHAMWRSHEEIYSFE